jgi:hypothetical protein
MINDWVVIALLFIVLLFALFFIPQFMMKRAIRAVIRIFRDNNAIGIKQAIAAEELGLQPRRMVERMMKPRDYKPRALQLLMSQEIIQMTEDGKLYLLEEKLDASRLKDI